MKQITLSILFYLASNFLFAQSLKKISGIILNYNNESIAFAHVFLKNNPEIGVVTNEVGKFTILIPSTILNDSLVIRHLVYLDKMLPLINHKLDTIYLQPKVNILEDVIISSTKDSASWIVRKSLDLIKKNYSKKTSFFEAFYRETHFVDHLNVKTTEAVINIQDFGYDTPNKTRILVKNLRQTDDNRERNQKMVFLAKTLGSYFNSNNQLYNTFDKDPLKHINDENYFFHRKNFLSNPMTLENILTNEVDTIYQISYYHAPNNSSFKRHVILSINSTDYAIVKIEIYYSITSRMAVDEYYINVEFSKKNNKYYLSLINYTYPDLTNVHPNSRGYQTINITSVLNRKQDSYKIKRKFAEKRSLSIYDKEYRYNRIFWDNYNKIEITPIENIVDYYNSKIDKLRNN